MAKLTGFSLYRCHERRCRHWEIDFSRHDSKLCSHSVKKGNLTPAGVVREDVDFAENVGYLECGLQQLELWECKDKLMDGLHHRYTR